MEKFQWKSESKNVKVKIFSDTGEARAFLLWRARGKVLVEKQTVRQVICPLNWLN